MLQKIKNAFGVGRSTSSSGTRIAINCEELETRVAVIQDGVLGDYKTERSDDDHLVGSIFKGRVKNLEPGLKAMFVDIGMERNGFLHYWDAIPAALDNEMEIVPRGNKGGKPKGKKKSKISSADIPKIYPVGSEVVLQVTKGPIGNKGPRVTTNISMAGRYLVLQPLAEQFGISRKIEDPKERARLRKIMEKLTVPEGMGLIMRTVAAGKRDRHFVRDLAILLEQWDEIVRVRDTNPAPVRCFEEPDIVERTVRDFLTDEVGEIVCDHRDTVERMRDLVGQISRRARKHIVHWSGPGALFEKLGIEKQIDEAFFREVWLPCGGYIVIDETEALVSIDVNTGRNRGSNNIDKTILQTNLEAADEAGRQLRLRDIGGLVVIDFIDMRQRRDQQAVFKRMKDAVATDRAKTHVLPISQLGLLEMTRQRLGESVAISNYEPCVHCTGLGKIKSLTTMSVELQRAIGALMQRHETENHDLLIIVSPEFMERLKKEDAKILEDMQRRYAARFTFRTDASFSRQKFVLANAETGDEIT